MVAPRVESSSQGRRGPALETKGRPSKERKWVSTVAPTLQVAPNGATATLLAPPGPGPLVSADVRVGPPVAIRGQGVGGCVTRPVSSVSHGGSSTGKRFPT